MAAALLAGCGSERAAPPGNRIPGRTLTIYASFPYLGPSGPSGEAALGGRGWRWRRPAVASVAIGSLCDR